MIYEVEYEFFISHIILFSCLIGAFVIFATYFFLRMREKEPKSLERVIFKGYCLFFLFYSLTRLFFLFSDFEIYYSKVDVTFFYVIYTGIAYSAGILGLICFFYAQEQTILNTKFVFTSLLFVILMLSIFTTLFIIPIGIFRVIISGSTSTFFFIILIYYIYVALNAPQMSTLLGGMQYPGQMRNRALIILLGYIIFLMGVGFDSRLGASILESLGFPYKIQISIIPVIILIGGAIFTFSQRDVLAKQVEVKGVFIISQGGQCMVEHKFKDILVDSYLVASVISAIESIITESVQTKKKLKIIDHEDVKILVEWGKYVNSAVIADKQTTDLRKNLKKFLGAFEKKYKPHIKKWSGDLDLFHDADKLIEKYFEFYISKESSNSMNSH